MIEGCGTGWNARVPAMECIMRNDLIAPSLVCAARAAPHNAVACMGLFGSFSREESWGKRPSYSPTSFRVVKTLVKRKKVGGTLWSFLIKQAARGPFRSGLFASSCPISGKQTTSFSHLHSGVALSLRAVLP